MLWRCSKTGCFGVQAFYEVKTPNGVYIQAVYPKTSYKQLQIQ